MIVLIVGLILLSWVFGRTRGLLGGLAGGLLGALVLTGMATTTGNGELAILYSPPPAGILRCSRGRSRSLALVARYATAVASLGLGAGTLLAAVVAPRSG